MLRLPPQDGTTRIVLVRHLEPAESARGRAYGALDVPLSADGRRLANALAVGLADVPIRAVYSSPLQRALDTASPLAARHGLAPIVDERLRELDFGDLEGRPYAAIEADQPELFRSWMQEPTRTLFPGGEAFADMRARVLAVSEEIRVRHAGTGVAVVAHGGVTRAIVAAALAIPDDALFRFDQSYGGVSVVDWLGDVPLVRVVNGTAFV